MKQATSKAGPAVDGTKSVRVLVGMGSYTLLLPGARTVQADLRKPISDAEPAHGSR